MAERDVDPLRCFICCDLYTNPKFLPCFHTFCASCLKEYITSNAVDKKINCPICGERCSVPINGVDGYMNNFYVTALEKLKISSNSVCDICGLEGQAAQNLCVECEQTLCSACSKAHLKVRATRKHKQITCGFSGPPSSPLGVLGPFCPKHPQQEVICRRCKEDAGPRTLTVKHVKNLHIPFQEHVQGICPVGGGKFWVCETDHTKVLLMNMDGLVLQSVPVGAGCRGAATDRDGNCLVVAETCIKRVKCTGFCDTLATDLLHIYGVSVARSKEGEEEIFYTKDCSDMCGAWLLKDGDGNKKTRTHIVGNICATYIAADEEGRLICLINDTDKEIVLFKKDGTILSRYKNEDEDFNPCGLSFDHEGHVLVADRGGKRILRINNLGELVQVLVEGLDPAPISVALDDDDHLLLGLEKGEIKIYKLE